VDGDHRRVNVQSTSVDREGPVAHTTLERARRSLDTPGKDNIVSISCCFSNFSPLQPKLVFALEFSPYLKEYTTLHHYKDQMVNAV
jgi:hypothetical protein